MRARQRKRLRRGSALLDVIMALVILGLSGVGLIAVVGQTLHSMRSVRTTEREIRVASGELDRFVAYDRTRLIAMIGSGSARGWTVTVSRPATDLFDVSVARDTSTVPLLRTTLYRPDTAHATP